MNRLWYYPARANATRAAGHYHCAQVNSDDLSMLRLCSCALPRREARAPPHDKRYLVMKMGASGPQYPRLTHLAALIEVQIGSVEPHEHNMVI